MGRKGAGGRRRGVQGRASDSRAAPVSASPPAIAKAGRTDIALRALAIVGLLLTVYLAWTASSGGPAFCTEGSGCDLVQASRWSRFLGLPIAAWGALLYAAIAWVAWRPAPRLARWRRLSRLSFLGLALSVYLTVAGLVAVQAVCAWCLVSLGLMLAIFLLVHLGRPDSAPGMPWATWWLGSGLVALGLVAALQLSAMGLLERREDPRLRALAEHLGQVDARFYGASWCPNCTEQKRLFGAAAPRLPYVECSPEGRAGGVAFECISARVSGYPTWIIDDRHHVEVLTPERLARLTGFDWEGAAPR
ncbi:vitamin K epoxide reductase family protein [Luteimonas kalidii]|uniref:Vitamin K epoxide reductase family protein n=1 Tax=Luteimonas kalidii TaxID=3042025 RepID=A0ABT6JRD7_9GAMM|nr:vitamin K epoxide reductase family protein [Luteimonas kalidii]MDH5833052.1 vitamin K epoxide reductase family protein [Luteimonas kalidii]